MGTEDPDKLGHNNNGLKTLGVITGLVALFIASTAAIVRPMQREITGLGGQLASIKETLNGQVANLKGDLNKHEAQNDHPWGVKAEIAAMSERFKEIETQFRGLREVYSLVEKRTDARLDILEEWRLWFERQSKTEAVGNK